MKTAVAHNSASALSHVTPTVERIWSWLANVMDPEVPVLSVVDLGIVRLVEYGANCDQWRVTITPTYSGCPAVAVIEQKIREELSSHGIRNVELRTRISPPWTTDWLAPAARQRLREYGIAPPHEKALSSAAELPILTCAKSPAVPCPRCGSRSTSSISNFGSTLCKALYRCMDCGEPFEHFKCH